MDGIHSNMVGGQSHGRQDPAYLPPEFIAAHRADRNGLRPELSAMTAKIRRRPAEAFALREDIPEHFANPDHQEALVQTKLSTLRHYLVPSASRSMITFRVESPWCSM